MHKFSKAVLDAFDPPPPKRPRFLPPGECAACDQDRDLPMAPAHFASDSCESGKRNHCSCDRCF